MDIQNINNIWLALLAGLISSPHCVAMCGPIAYIFLSPSDNAGPIQKIQAIYHCARIFSFTAFGALAGSIGFGVVQLFQFPAVQYFPWVLILFLILFGIGADKWIPKPKALTRAFQQLSQRVFKLSKPYAALSLGLVTPFLPCGPLYMILWVALLSGSPLLGAQIGLGYGLGTLPLMWIAQYPFFKMKQHLSARILSFLKRSIALIAAFLITWRVLSATGPLSAEFCCPF